MCVVTGISPNTGQTLPLISRGGSSLLATSMAIGACIGITRHIREDEYQSQLEKEEEKEKEKENQAEEATTTEADAQI